MDVDMNNTLSTGHFHRSIAFSLLQLASTFYWSLLFTYLQFLGLVRKIQLFTSYFWRKSTVPTNCERIPQHIAFLINDKRHLNPDLISSLIRHCSDFNIGCITLCDPWSLLRNDATLKAECANSPLPNLPKLCWLGANDGQCQLVRACKKLSSSMEPVTAEMISQYIENEHGDASATELDFLVSIGPEFHTSLAGLSPWAIRTTELHSITGFAHFDSASKQEFASLIAEYSRRSRRFGR